MVGRLFDLFGTLPQDRRFKPLDGFPHLFLRRSENRCNGLPKQNARFVLSFVGSLLISENSVANKTRFGKYFLKKILWRVLVFNNFKVLLFLFELGIAKSIFICHNRTKEVRLCIWRKEFHNILKN